MSFDDISDYPSLVKCLSLASHIDITESLEVSFLSRERGRRILRFLLAEECKYWPEMKVEKNIIKFEWERDSIIFQYEVSSSRDEWEEERELESIRNIIVNFEE